MYKQSMKFYTAQACFNTFYVSQEYLQFFICILILLIYSAILMFMTFYKEMYTISNLIYIQKEHSLQKRQISRTSPINQSAWRKICLQSHHCLYHFIPYIIDIDLLRRTSHKMIQFIDAKKVWSYNGCCEMRHCITRSMPWSSAAMSFWTPMKASHIGKNSGYPACRFCIDHLSLKTTSILVFAVT